MKPTDTPNTQDGSIPTPGSYPLYEYPAYTFDKKYETSFPQQDNPPHGYRIFLSASTHLQGRWGSCTHDRDKGSCGHRCISSTSS